MSLSVKQVYDTTFQTRSFSTDTDLLYFIYFQHGQIVIKIKNLYLFNVFIPTRKQGLQIKEEQCLSNSLVNLQFLVNITI